MDVSFERTGVGPADRAETPPPCARQYHPEGGQGRCGAGRDQQARHAPRAPAFVRHAPARSRNRYSHGAGSPRARETGDDADLYTCDAETWAGCAFAAGSLKGWVEGVGV